MNINRLGLFLLPLLAACGQLNAAAEQSPPQTNSQVDDAARIKAATEIAAKVTQELTKLLQKTQGTNSAINVNIHVGDILLVGFDEAIDAEEWGMVDNQVEGSGPAHVHGKKVAPATGTPREKTVRSIDIRKGKLILVAAEETTPLDEPAVKPHAPTPVGSPKPAESPKSLEPVKAAEAP